MIYISIDIETDGLFGGASNILSIGAVACYFSTPLILTENSFFSINLEPCDFEPDESTTQWWSEQDPKVYAAARSNSVPPGVAMREFMRWCELMRKHSEDGEIYGFARPLDFEASFLRPYYAKYGYVPCIERRMFCLSSYGAGLIKAKRPLRSSEMPPEWWEGIDDNPHVAVVDARNQAKLFAQMHGARYIEHD